MLTYCLTSADRPCDQIERLDEWKVPPQLATLTDDDADVQCVRLATAPQDHAGSRSIQTGP